VLYKYAPNGWTKLFHCWFVIVLFFAFTGRGLDVDGLGAQLSYGLVTVVQVLWLKDIFFVLL
jgi:hypothetical protein